MLDRVDSELVRDRREGGGGRGGELLLHTHLLGQNYRGLLTLGGSQHSRALLQLLLLLLGVRQLEAFLLLK